MEMLFGKLPEFLTNEAELRTLWSAPRHPQKTAGRPGRKRLRQRTTDRDAKDHRRRKERPLRRPRSRRLGSADCHPRTPSHHRLSRNYRSLQQQAFLEFVLAHDITEGVGELDREKLTPLLKFKYHNSLPDALADLGKADEIGQVFAGFQRYLYQQQGVA